MLYIKYCAWPAYFRVVIYVGLQYCWSVWEITVLLECVGDYGTVGVCGRLQYCWSVWEITVLLECVGDTCNT